MFLYVQYLFGYAGTDHLKKQDRKKGSLVFWDVRFSTSHFLWSRMYFMFFETKKYQSCKNEF